MGQLHSAFGCSLLIGGLVAGAAWYARYSDTGHSPEAYFQAASPSESASLPPVFGRLEWGTSGDMHVLAYGSNTDLGITLYDLSRKGGRTVADVELGPASVARLSPDGRHVLAATSQGALWWIDVKSPDSSTKIAELPHPELFRTIALASNGEWIAAGSTSGMIYLCDPRQDGDAVRRINAGSFVADVRFSNTGLSLVSAHADGSIRVWDVATGGSLAEFSGHDRGAFAASFLPAGGQILSAGADDTLRMWEVTSGRELWRQQAKPLGAMTLAVSDDGRLAAWGGQSHCIVVWGLNRGESKFEIFTTAASVSHLNFSPDGSLLAAVETDAEKSVRLYDMQRGAAIRRISMEGEFIP
jgi:WD40 repeat protein